ncbi:CobW family GTP-binding protein [Rhizobium helianthi]|uniref:CobW family GTP-binding protein n=1 Tax=Rhizobium helianthi TaxID=1132695 RepID=A0ABW4M4I3_9HYPH
MFKAREPKPAIDEGRGQHAPLPVTILTGFLGSGKTSLINRLLRHPNMAGTAVIINEFGTIPVDHDLVQAGSETYFQTTTGCICCTATGDIRASLHDLHEAQAKGSVRIVERVVIETTGLADPAPIINSLIAGGAPAMSLRDHVVARRFYLAGVVTAFDVISGRDMLAKFMEGWKQLAFADHIVLTKTDLAESDQDLADLRELNPSALLHDRHSAEFDLPALFGSAAYTISGKIEDVEGWLAIERLSKHGDHTHDPNRHGAEIEAVCLTHDVPLEPAAVETFLHIVTSNVGSGLLRLKGIFALADDLQRPMVAHAVQHRLYPTLRLPEWPGSDCRSRVVLIGSSMPKRQIQDLFEVLAPRARRKRGQSL